MVTGSCATTSNPVSPHAWFPGRATSADTGCEEAEGVATALEAGAAVALGAGVSEAPLAGGAAALGAALGSSAWSSNGLVSNPTGWTSGNVQPGGWTSGNVTLSDSICLACVGESG